MWPHRRPHLFCANHMKRMKAKKITTEPSIIGIDLFAGAGGFTLAAKAAGIKIKAAVEVNKHACNTYRKNFITRKHNPPKLFEQDIVSLDIRALMADIGLARGQCDILLGGPPCQGFSTHRINNAGIDDPRNGLLLKYFEFIEHIQPKFFVVENVPGLLWKRHEKYLKKFISDARATGYTVFPPTVLNAKDFGVPQNRKRVFIVGVRNGLNLNVDWPPNPTHFSPGSRDERGRALRPWRASKVAFDKPLSPDDVNAVHLNHSAMLIEVFAKTPLNGGSRSQSGRVLPCHDDHDGHKDVYGRIDPLKPSPTMTTACINPSKGRFVHPTENHGITARHAARLQTFPESFIFEGGIIAAGVQIGNAVPVQLGSAVLEPLVSALKNQ